jgi:hypothetical protein
MVAAALGVHLQADGARVVHAFGVNLWMSQSFYRIGDTIIVYWDFRCGPNGGMSLTFMGPYTTTTGTQTCDFVRQGYLIAGVAEPQDSGEWTVYGEFTGCSDIVPIQCETARAQTYFTVESVVVVAQTLTLTRTRTLTQLETSYIFTTRSITKSSKVTATSTETVTAEAQTEHITLTDMSTQFQCSPMTTTTLTLSDNLSQRPSIATQIVSISFLSLLAILVPYTKQSPRRKEVAHDDQKWRA